MYTSEITLILFHSLSNHLNIGVQIVRILSCWVVGFLIHTQSSWERYLDSMKINSYYLYDLCTYESSLQKNDIPYFHHISINKFLALLQGIR